MGDHVQRKVNMNILGKRSAKTDNSASKRSSSSVSANDSTFYRILNETGLHLSRSRDQFNQLNIDQAVFKFKLTQKLHHDFAHELADEICDGFLKHVEKSFCFNQCLIATRLIPLNAGSTPIVQESVVRLLLSIEKLQPKIVTILLEKMPEFMEDSLRDNNLTKEEFQQIPGLILNQLKWLDCIVDGKELCSKLLEILTIAPVELQRNIITSLPEILDDSAHRTVALHLKELLKTDLQLTSAIIDCFTNLHLSDDISTDILTVALQRVDSADFADLPSLLSFILQSAATLDIESVILQLREKLTLPSTFVAPLISSTPRSRCTRGIQSGNEFMVFDSLRSLICFQTKVADGWMKVIQGVESSQHHKVIDIFVLFILHSISSRKKSVEVLFKNKIKNGLFTEELIGEAFSAHIDALQGCFSSILGLAEALMRCNASAVQSFAGVLYQHIFTCFDVYCQQEVIGTLVSHIGSGISTEANAALDVLDALVVAKLQDVQRFTLIIKGLLDYLNQMDGLQIRKLYSILITLSFCGEESAASSVQDEVHTVIRKQLSHVDPKYRKMGIIGAMMIIKKVGQSISDYTVISESDSTHLGSSSQLVPLTRATNSIQFKQVMPVLKMLMDLCSRSVDSVVLFYDEMASAISSDNIDLGITDYISKTITSDFQDFYLVESETALPNVFDIPMKYLYGLDSSEEVGISLNLLSLVLKQTENSASSLRCMPSHFRLLQATEAALHHGSLEGIDALLGCSVVACSQDSDYSKFTSLQRETICFTFFHLINWFRELVTTFSVEKDPEMRAKVMIRLQAITELQCLLEDWISGTPTFLPALANLYGDKSAIMVLSGSGGKKGKKSGSTSASKVDITHGGEKDTTTLLDKTSMSVSSNIKAFMQPFWRPLGLNVFSILNYGILQTSVVGSSTQHMRKEVKIGPDQLLFLLQDLYNKVKILVPSFPSGKFVAVKAHCLEDISMGIQYDAKDLATLVTSLMKVLSQKLDECSVYFQSQLSDNDGIEDCLIPSSSNDLGTVTCQQFKLIFQIMSSFLSWPKLSQPESHHLLKDFCVGFTGTMDKLQITLEQAAITAVRYIGTLSVCLPNLCCGYVMIKTLIVLINVTKAFGMKDFVAELSGKLLKKCWQGDETTQQRNEAISYLLKYHVAWSHDCLEKIEVICANAIPATLEEAEADDDKYQTLTSQTVSCYYRVMMIELVNHLKKVRTISEDNSHRLMQLEISARVLSMMIQVVKAFDKRSILGNALRYGQQYVETFLKSSMPFLDSEFRNNKDEILQLLKSLQQSTRSMQHFCTYSKVHQDVTLTQHVPALKKSLERLIFRVKDMLCKHNCEGAFWMGNLKNRDIQGNEILSQSQSVANVTNQEICAQTEEGSGDCSSGNEHIVDDGDGEILSLDEE